MKYLLISLVFAFLLFSGFNDNQVWVKAKMPQIVYSGDRFTVEITINKLDLQNFAEFKQILPTGFTAIEKKSGSAIFSFKGQVVKYTWVRLPRVPTITLTYDVVVKDNVLGEQALPGQFTYIYKNERGTAELAKDKINVLAKSLKNQRNTTPVVENLTFPPKDRSTIQCLRPIPVFSNKYNGYSVRLWVSLGNIKGNAKIEETIPVGYVASVIESKGASFNFENNKVEFFWMKLPEQKNIEISYKLVPVPNKPAEPAITGKLIYMSDGRQITVPVHQISSKN